MNNKIKMRTVIAVVAVVLECWALYVVGASPEQWRPGMIVKDEPVARALYEAMIKAMREAESLSYTSVCSGPDERISTHKIWLKKPSYFRAEVTNGPSTRASTLVGDGDKLWIYWSGNRPFLGVDDADSYEKTRLNVYIQKADPAGRDSIASEIALLGIAWFGTILDPSTFHGYTDSLEPYIDGVRARGTNKAGGEECDVIEVSFMKAQRTRYFWLSRRDHLPRKVKEIVRTVDNRVIVEDWSDLAVNPEIPQKMFAWSPPEGWRPWSPPKPGDSLLTSGREAPDFELLSVHKGTIRLSDYRGKAVWLYMWQVGSPRCREEIRHLQGWYEKHKDKGVVIIGFNHGDDKRIVRAFMRENPVTFPNILDSSADAERTALGYKMTGVPLNYIIDGEGKVVDAWYGYEEGHKRAIAAMEKSGVKLEDR